MHCSELAVKCRTQFRGTGRSGRRYVCLVPVLPSVVRFYDGVDFRSMPVAVLDWSSRISSSGPNPLIRKRIPTEATSSFAPKNELVARNPLHAKTWQIAQHGRD